jgi:hypothetical protein
MPNTYTLNYSLPKPSKSDMDWDDEWQEALDDIDSLIKAVNDALATHQNTTNNPHSVTFLQLTDTPSSYAGLANRVVVVNSTATGLTTVTRVPDSDKLGGYSPGTEANNILKLDAEGKVPLGNIPTLLTGKNADLVDSLHFKTENGLLYFSPDGSNWTIAGEMTKAEYDSDDDGKVDVAEYADAAGNADTVDGKHDSDIVLKENTTGTYINVPTGKTVSFKVNNTITAYVNNYGLVGSVYNSDFAEGFITSEIVKPDNGTVMIFDPQSGKVKVCNKRNSQRFAGVVSYTPGHLLGMTDDYEEEFYKNHKIPLALVGQVYVRVKNNSFSAIKPGDALMTSHDGGLTKCSWFGHKVATAMEFVPAKSIKLIKVLLK